MEKVNLTHREAIDKMLAFNENSPEVGIFWVDDDDLLFDVYSISINDLKKEQMTLSKLHKTIWHKQRAKAIQKADKDSVYLRDYTQVKRGRIFYKEDVFFVMTGSWINDKIKEQILDEFNLTGQKVEFRIDIHWELGHGWSSENDKLEL